MAGIAHAVFLCVKALFFIVCTVLALGVMVGILLVLITITRGITPDELYSRPFHFLNKPDEQQEENKQQ